MAEWANALMQGIGAAANTGAGMIGDQMKQDAAAQAEQRAADIKLDTAERLMSMETAMKARAAERFSSVVKDKMGEELPATPQTVVQTGVTRESAHAIGLEDGIAGGAPQIAETMRKYTAAANNPNLTPEQRADAQGVVDQLTKQVNAQGDLNVTAAEGKTRSRTLEEATQAAKDYALQNDPMAYVAGTGMLATADKQDATERAAALKEKLANQEAQRKERQAEADRESRESIATNRDDQREKAADQRFEAMMARIDAGATGKAGNKSAMVQNLEWLRENLKMDDAQLLDFVTEKKHTSPEDIAAKLLSADKYGELTPETAMQRAMGLMEAGDKLRKNGGAGAAPGSKPKADSGKTLTYDPKTGKFN